MPLLLERAQPADAGGIAALRMAAALTLTRRFGAGTWSFSVGSSGGIRAEILASNVFVARCEGELVASVRLGTRNPWLGDIGFFSPRARPLYLTSMVVAPRWQRRGVGRSFLSQLPAQAHLMNGDAVRLDTYAGPAGAADFYRKCGYHEVHRADYHGTPLIWFELLLDTASPTTRELQGAAATR